MKTLSLQLPDEVNEKELKMAVGGDVLFEKVFFLSDWQQHL